MRDRDTTFVVRTSEPIGDAMRAIKGAAARINPVLLVSSSTFSPTKLQESLLRERLTATLSGAFGILACILATIGVYGVLAYAMTRRRNEIGVRIALGATRGQIVQMTIREAVLLLGAGLTAGAIFAQWEQPAAETLLFGLKPHDPRWRC